MIDDEKTPIDLPALFVPDTEPTLADVVRQQCAGLLLVAAACEGTRNLNGSNVASAIRSHVRLMKEARAKELDTSANVNLTHPEGAA